MCCLLRQMPVLDYPEIRYNRSMTDQEFFTLMQMWGYYLEPKAHVFSPGYAGLSVAIRARPTHQHYDPEMIELCLLNEDEVERTRLGLQKRSHTVRRVCPGRVTLYDRFLKRTDFYTYGAELFTTAGNDETLYCLASGAPILWLVEDDDYFPEQLEAETEALLAGIRTQWRCQDSLFRLRLVDIDPLDLYFASLRSIANRYLCAQKRQKQFHTFYENLQREILWQQMTGRFHLAGPPLETLLHPPNGIIT